MKVFGVNVHGPRTYARIAYTAGKSPEPLVERFLLNQHGDLFVDIGAYHGYYAKRLTPFFKRVVAIEPSPQAFKILTRRLEDHGVETLPYAITDKDGDGNLFMNQYNHMTLLQDGLPQHLVNTRRFDTLFPGAALAKIDVEGVELQVLEGMSRCLVSGSVQTLCIETHHPDTISQVRKLLKQYHYRTWMIDENHVGASIQDYADRNLGP